MHISPLHISRKKYQDKHFSPLLLAPVLPKIQFQGPFRMSQCWHEGYARLPIGRNDLWLLWDGFFFGGQYWDLPTLAPSLAFPFMSLLEIPLIME